MFLFGCSILISCVLTLWSERKWCKIEYCDNCAGVTKVPFWCPCSLMGSKCTMVSWLLALCVAWGRGVHWCFGCIIIFACISEILTSAFQYILCVPVADSRDTLVSCIGLLLPPSGRQCFTKACVSHSVHRGRVEYRWGAGGRVSWGYSGARVSSWG